MQLSFSPIDPEPLQKLIREPGAAVPQGVNVQSRGARVVDRAKAGGQVQVMTADQDRLGEVCIVQVGPREAHAIQRRVCELGVTQVGIPEVHPIE